MSVNCNGLAAGLRASVRHHAGALLVTLAFTAVAAAGFAQIWRHGQSAGDRGAPPSLWPVDTTLSTRPGQPRVVMFAHPRCPCTRSSLAELERIVARSGGEAQVIVAFYSPKEAPEPWARSDAWEFALRIPGVEVVADENGAEARRFGAATSGMTVAYDVSGQLEFAGGVTPARGHEGSNEATLSLSDVLARRRPARSACDVYGCPIFADSLEGLDSSK